MWRRLAVTTMWTSSLDHSASAGGQRIRHGAEAKRRPAGWLDWRRMTQTTPPDEAAFPPQPTALARAVAMQLVTRYRLRLSDPRDPRLGELGPDYELATVAWTGARSAFVGFFRPPADPASQIADLHRRIGAALRWGDARLHLQGAQRCDILLIALGPLAFRLPPPAHPAVSVGVVWADPTTGAADALLAPPPGTPTVREIRAMAGTLHDGAEAPTLAAVDLAEREAVAAGTVAPTRRVMLTTPRLTYAMVGAFVGIFLIENTVINRYSAQASGDLGYLGSGALSFGETQFGQNGSDWWRFLSTAFLHNPGGLGITTYLSVHLLVNCYSTVVLGRIVEPLYGRLMMLATFVTTAFAASLVSVGAASLGLPGASFATVGASGGLMGLLGLLLVLGRRQGKDVPAGLVRVLRQGVIISVILTAAIGFIVPNVNNYAHLGGFCAGALIGLVMPPVHAIGGRDLARWEKVAFTAVIAVGAVAMIFAAVNLVQVLTTFPASPAPGL